MAGLLWTQSALATQSEGTEEAATPAPTRLDLIKILDQLIEEECSVEGASANANVIRFNLYPGYQTDQGEKQRGETPIASVKVATSDGTRVNAEMTTAETCKIIDGKTICERTAKVVLNLTSDPQAGGSESASNDLSQRLTTQVKDSLRQKGFNPDTLVLSDIEDCSQLSNLRAVLNLEAAPNVNNTPTETSERPGALENLELPSVPLATTALSLLANEPSPTPNSTRPLDPKSKMCTKDFVQNNTSPLLPSGPFPLGRCQTSCIARNARLVCGTVGLDLSSQ